METLNKMEARPTYQEFQELPDWQRMKIAAENRVINTDAYNRTMDHVRGPEGWHEEETYVLQMRRSPYGYLVAAGIEDMAAELTSQPITQSELDFAVSFYEENNVPFFNKDMWQAIIDDCDGYLPIEIHGVQDGTVMLPGEPMFYVTGPGELIAHFEHVFHRVYYPTLVATKAHEIREAVGDPNRFIEVGKRSTPDEITHMMATKAMQIGGGFGLTSNDAAVAAHEDMKSVGTIGHRYVQRFPSVEQAFRHAIDNLDSVSLLVDLVDSYQGLDLALELKEEYRQSGKKIWVRLDSGNIAEQTRYYLDRCNELGFIDPVLDKLVVEGIESLDEIKAIEATLGENEKQRVVYGAGGLLVADQTTRSDASTGFKLSEYENAQHKMTPTMKFSDSPGKQSLPGMPAVTVIDGQRTIAQADWGEAESGNLFVELYSLDQANTRVRVSATAEAFGRCQQQYEVLKPMIEKGERAAISPQTARKIGAVTARYELEA